MPRFFVPSITGPQGEYALPDGAAHHAARVLRLTVGDVVSVFDGAGSERAARITRINKQGVMVQLGELSTPQRETLLHITLIQGVSSGERMDFTLQKAVELGVKYIQPVSCVRSVVRLSGDRAIKRQQHWQQLVTSACEQCGRNVVPTVSPIADLTTVIAQTDAGLRLLLDPLSVLTLRDVSPPSGSIYLLAGPEGGFDPNERELALRAGFQGVRLGPRILRTETAALAAVSAMQTLWGDF